MSPRMRLAALLIGSALVLGCASGQYVYVPGPGQPSSCIAFAGLGACVFRIEQPGKDYLDFIDQERQKTGKPPAACFPPDRHVLWCA